MEMKRRAYLADKFGPDSLGRVVEDFDAELARAKLEVYFDHGPMEVFYFDRTGEFLRNGRRFPLNYALLELFLSPFNPELWHTEYLPVPATDAPQEHH